MLSLKDTGGFVLKETMKTKLSWKTTLTGVGAIAAGIIRLVFAIINHAVTEEAVLTFIGGLLTGLGLLFARDNNVTSEEAGLK